MVVGWMILYKISNLAIGHHVGVGGGDFTNLFFE